MTAVARRVRAIAALTLLLGACGHDSTAPAPHLATIAVTLTPAAVQVGATATATAAGLDQNGSPIATGAVTWSSGTPAVATVSPAGNITAIMVGEAQIVASAGGRQGQALLTVTAAPLAAVSVSPPTAAVTVGTTVQLNAFTLDAAGAVLTGHPVTWSTSDATKATVSSTGLVTGVAAGNATITAASESKSGTAAITVTPVGDIAIVDAQFTQGVQTPGATIPMVLGGSAAVVNVLLSATAATLPPMQVVLRLYDANGALVRTDTARTSGALGAAPSYSAPSVQFLVPASAISTGLHWQVERDPQHLLRDDSAADDVFPRSGRAALATIAVPPLTVRFVPIVLAANGGTAANVSAATLPQYLQTLLSIHPLGTVNAHVGATFTTNANFGTAPSGGAAAFWQQLISELDLARLADPVEPASNWFGLVLPPPGFNFTSYGGFSYIPSSGASTGANTRTSAAVQAGWFSRPTQTRDLVAHEIGHTFGRQHAPCGGAGAPLDPTFPTPGGTLDFAGHDVFSWANGLTSSAATVSTATGDVMGYCFPVWASTYTYSAVLAFRGATALMALLGPPPISPVLVIRGRVENGSDILLEPAFAFNARPSLPERSGDYTAEGLDSLGNVLFSYRFEPAVLDHAANIRPFTLSIPNTPELEQRLESIVVRGPGAERTLARARAGRITAEVVGGAARIVALSRATTGMVNASCTDASSRGILVVDGRTGSVLGTAAAASMRLVAPAGTPLEVVCSDGVRSQRAASVAP